MGNVGVPLYLEINRRRNSSSSIVDSHFKQSDDFTKHSPSNSNQAYNLDNPVLLQIKIDVLFEKS